jgi:hypothetical protein
MRILALEILHPEFWELEVAALLTPLGAAGVAACSGRPLGTDAFSGDCPQAAATLWRKIPRMEKIAPSLAYVGKSLNGLGLPWDGVAGAQIRLGSRTLRVARDLEEHLGSGHTPWARPRALNSAPGLLFKSPGQTQPNPRRGSQPVILLQTAHLDPVFPDRTNSLEAGFRRTQCGDDRNARAVSG